MARRRRTTEVREDVAAAPRRPRPFWPWLLLLLLLVAGALAASWYFTQRDETVPADDVPDVTGLTRPAAEERLRELEFEVEIERVVSRRAAGVVVTQRPEPGTLYGEGGIVVLSIARDPLRTEVPDVSGLPLQRALARLRGAELRPRAQEVQSREPQGTVLRQLPPAGDEVPVGSPAIVVVASGPELSTVPNVVGLTSGEASTRLTNAGFRTRVDRVPSDRPEGRVVAQNPRAGGRALQDTVVRINVSMGPGAGTTTVTTTTATTGAAQASVPDTVGEDEVTARSTLEGAGFTVRVVERTTTDSTQDGIVMAQRPPGGSEARSGANVTIFVGRLR